MTAKGAELTLKQERFALNLFSGVSQRDSYVNAGYAKNSSLVIIDANASRLASSEKLLARLAELRQAAEDESVASVLERKQILTEIARGNLLDYQEVGADGSYLNIDKNSPNSRAISEITSRTEYNKDESSAAVVTRVKMHNPMPAVDILNKMDKIYSDTPQQTNINVVFIIGKGYVNIAPPAILKELEPLPQDMGERQEIRADEPQDIEEE
jgi:phage terminase small subunit